MVRDGGIIIAFCPNCHLEIPATAVVCPHCEYDFPEVDTPAQSSERGFPYNSLANIALLISTVAAGIGMAAALFFSVIALCSGDLCSGLFLGPVAFFVQMGLMVVFLRVQDL